MLTVAYQACKILEAKLELLEDAPTIDIPAAETLMPAPGKYVPKHMRDKDVKKPLTLSKGLKSGKKSKGKKPIDNTEEDTREEVKNNVSILYTKEDLDAAQARGEVMILYFCTDQCNCDTGDDCNEVSPIIANLSKAYPSVCFYYLSQLRSFYDQETLSLLRKKCKQQSKQWIMFKGSFLIDVEKYDGVLEQALISATDVIERWGLQPCWSEGGIGREFWGEL